MQSLTLISFAIEFNCGYEDSKSCCFYNGFLHLYLQYIMAYGTRYSIAFKNREGTDCEVLLRSNDDYAGDITSLVGTDSPFILQSNAQANQIPYGIVATTAIINFYNGSLSLIDFYNEDDTFWLVDFFYGVDRAWQGFLQLDDSGESITDVQHVISLSANDGLGRLETQYFLNEDGTPIRAQWKLTDFFLYVLTATGLTLETKAWLNIFENSTEDRTDHDYLTFLPQTVISTNYFINDDGATQNLYEALNNILVDFRCELRQAGGLWQIIRWGDVRLFADGTMPGTLYNEGFSGASAITFPSALQIGRYSEGYLPHPINENQLGQILRPYKFSKETFNYDQPAFITQANLQMETGAVPYETSTVDDIRTDKYSLATYFPNWKQRDDDTSYLEVKTDVSTTPENEIERYIVTPAPDNATRGVEFNPIPVSKNDLISFNLQYRTVTDTNQVFSFWVRFDIFGTDGICYSLFNFPLPNQPNPGLIWDTADPTGWDQFPGAFIYISDADVDDIDTTQYLSYNLDAQLSGKKQVPLVPVDGMMLIQVCGTNNTDSGFTDSQTTCWKDIQLTISNYVNQSTQIIGQIHNTEQAPAIKNNLQRNGVFDDTARNTISGTLFTNATTNFDYTDSGTGEETDIGNIYFTRTFSWHRSNIAESRRLGDLNTNNDVFIQRILRTIISGDFFGLNGVNFLSLFSVSWLPNKNFIFGTGSIDFMTCVWNGNLYELFDTGEVDEDLTATYTFNYIYDTNR